MAWFMPVLAVLIVLGALGGMNAWMLGPSKGLLMASRDGSLPASLSFVNKEHVPTRILLLQAIIFTGLCSTFLFMPTVSSSFWILSAITSILALIVYVIMFAAAVKLRYKHAHVVRAFTIPGGKFGLWLTCSLGLSSCLFTIFIGFLPPSQIAVGNIVTYETILIVGVILSCLVPFIVYHLNQMIQKKTAAHRV
jgi:amino acid transporter